MELDEHFNPWQTLSSRKVYENSWISLREDEVLRPDGEPGIYGVVHFRNVAVGVIALEEDDSIYLVGQYRYTLERYSWEIPEGGCPETEDTLRAARRELEEETGLHAQNWVQLGEAHLSNSVTDEVAIWYLATGLTQGKKPGGDGKTCPAQGPIPGSAQDGAGGRNHRRAQHDGHHAIRSARQKSECEKQVETCETCRNEKNYST